jgi:hypothetical protein
VRTDHHARIEIEHARGTQSYAGYLICLKPYGRHRIKHSLADTPGTVLGTGFDPARHAVPKHDSSQIVYHSHFNGRTPQVHAHIVGRPGRLKPKQGNDLRHSSAQSGDSTQFD